MAESLPWYHGSISSNEAMRICTRIGENGAFLLRDSQRDREAFTMSVFYKKEKCEAGEIYHYRIKKTPGGRLLLKIMKKDFASWDELVKFCKKKQHVEKFPQPLVQAIDKSFVDDWDRVDVKWRESIQMERRKPEVTNEVLPSKSKWHKKASAPGRITEFFRKPHKLFANKEKVECDQVNHEKDDYDEWNDGLSESEDDVDVSCHAIPVDCGEKFIAKTDSTGQENEMDFKKGDEMILQGVRTDGWWYCLNKERNTYGWVHESSLQKC